MMGQSKQTPRGGARWNSSGIVVAFVEDGGLPTTQVVSELNAPQRPWWPYGWRQAHSQAEIHKARALYLSGQFGSRFSCSSPVVQRQILGLDLTDSWPQGMEMGFTAARCNDQTPHGRGDCGAPTG
jgi:hypothetical protein